MADPIEAAILRTVLYADVFKFPLTSDEIHHFLIHGEPVTLAHIQHVLAASPYLKKHLIFENRYVAAADSVGAIAVRAGREEASRQLFPLALDYGVWLSRLPFVRMVALTGALAMHNAIEGDDLDFMLVTTHGRVWIARACAIALVRLARLRGVELCPNYVLAEDALVQARQDVFIAHEITQMVPVYGNDLYWAMRHANEWVGAHLPNAAGVFHRAEERPLGGVWRGVKHMLEWLLGGRAGDAIEQWEYQRKLRRFAPKMQTADSAAQLDTSQVKGHFNDHGNRVLRQYEERLARYGLDGTSKVELQAGD